MDAQDFNFVPKFPPPLGFSVSNFELFEIIFDKKKIF